MQPRYKENKYIFTWMSILNLDPTPPVATFWNFNTWQVTFILPVTNVKQKEQATLLAFVRFQVLISRMIIFKSVTCPKITRPFFCLMQVAPHPIIKRTSEGACSSIPSLLQMITPRGSKFANVNWHRGPDWKNESRKEEGLRKHKPYGFTRFLRNKNRKLT